MLHTHQTTTTSSHQYLAVGSQAATLEGTRIELIASRFWFQKNVAASVIAIVNVKHVVLPSVPIRSLVGGRSYMTFWLWQRNTDHHVQCSVLHPLLFAFAGDRRPGWNATVHFHHIFTKPSPTMRGHAQITLPGLHSGSLCHQEGDIVLAAISAPLMGTEPSLTNHTALVSLGDCLSFRAGVSSDEG